MLPSLLPFLLLLILFQAAPLRAGEDDGVRIDPFGDFRLRNEWTDFPDRPDRFRPRIRLRFGAVVDVGSDLYVGGRVVTGNPDDYRPVLFRGVGPSLSTFGVSGALGDPTLGRHGGELRPSLSAGLRVPRWNDKPRGWVGDRVE